MIKICSCCSKIDENFLASKLNGETIEIGCIDNCADATGRSFGLVDGELLFADDEEAFVIEVSKRK